MIKFLITFLLIPFLSFSYEYQLSICAIFQNEAPYLKEWIDYHKSKGVEHFYLYNNNSTDNYMVVLFPYISTGYVELIQWPTNQLENDWHNFSFTTQTGAYNDGLIRSKDISKWLALIDTDEFIVPIKYDSIIDLLETEFSHVSGLCVNWQCYGTSHVDKFPEGKMLHILTMKMKWNHDWNKHSKSIVQPLHVISCPNPHYCLYSANHWHVDSNYIKCDMVCESVNIDKIRINHYWTRDKDYLNKHKIPRYKKWGGDVDGIMKHANQMNEEYDPILRE